MQAHRLASEPATTSGRSHVTPCRQAALPRGSRGRVQAAQILQPQLSPTQQLGSGIRSQFPLLHQELQGRPLVYLDNAATSQKPTAVINAMDEYYNRYNSNVHRGVHALSAKATTEYEVARQKVARLVNASTCREIVFTRNATEAINLVAYSWAMLNLKPGDEILVSVAEHHSNMVPWQIVASRTGAVLRHVRLTPNNQEIDLDHFKELLSPRTKLVAMVHVSNMLGAVLDTSYVVEEAKKVGARVLLDCCQSVPHCPVDVQALGADWIVASSHKFCGPTGIGFLWGRYDVLEEMAPWMGGGEMIQDVFLDHSTYAAPPMRFEAGTPAIAEAIGMGAAAQFLMDIGMDNVTAYEHEIGGYLWEKLSAVDGVTLYGPPPSHPRGRASLAAFNVEGLHATDVSTLLDASAVAVRSGHHCTQPLHKYLGLNASARASAYIYNTPAEVDVFVDALKETISFFKDLH